MTLERLQNDFFEWVAGSEEIPSEPAAKVVDGGALEPSTRVGIYAEMYWLRMRDALRDDFSKVAKAVGDEAFEVLVAKYIKAHPSRHFSLGQVGRGFAEFLQTEAPELSGIAALQWAEAQAFVAPDSPVIEAKALSVINEETFASVRLTAAPSLRMAGRTVVWRRGFEVFHVEVSEPEARALVSLLAGEGSLPALCEPFAEPADAFTAIASWVNEGMIAALEVAGSALNQGHSEVSGARSL